MSDATPAPPRVVLYGRTSHDANEGRSVDAQLGELRRWADATGRVVVGELRDDGYGASRHSRGRARPGWQHALDLITAREVDELGLWEVSRSTRDRAVWAALFASCIENDVKIAVNGKVHDPDDADDAFLLDLGIALAVREATVTAKRTRRGKRACAMSGRPHGALNYGYWIEYDPATGKPKRRVPDPQQAAILREIARRLLAGETASSVARDLNARRVRTSRTSPPKGGRVSLRKPEWNGANIARLVRSPALAGLRVHDGKVLPEVVATWEPILTVDEHRQLTALLTDPSRRTARTGRLTRYLLPGIAECGKCGGPIRAVTRIERSGGRSVRYQCRKSFCVSRRADDVDELVERVIVAVLSRPDLAAMLSADDPEVTAASEELARLRAELDEGRRLVAAGRLSFASLADVEQRTLPRIEKLRRAARPRHVPSVVLDNAGSQAADLWRDLDVASRREIVRVLARVRILPAGHRDGFTPFDPTSVEVIPRVPAQNG